MKTGDTVYEGIMLSMSGVPTHWVADGVVSHATPDGLGMVSMSNGRFFKPLDPDVFRATKGEALRDIAAKLREHAAKCVEEADRLEVSAATEVAKKDGGGE